MASSPIPTDVPEVPILLLGDADVGKSTFLSRLTLGSHGHDTSGALPKLRDLDQPFPFNISLYNRPYRFEFYDTASPENYTLLKPAVIVLCYSIADPESLASLQTYWKNIVEEHFNYDEQQPVVMLGLKRDVRQREDYDGRVRPMARSGEGESGEGEGEGEGEVLNGRSFVYPQTALRIAQEMRLDRYCECSALTGELCKEVFQDVARTACLTTTSKGGRTEGTQCAVM